MRTGLSLIVVALVLLIVGGVASGACISQRLEEGREIGAPLARAQVAADPFVMDELMADVQTGMEENGRTSGHWQPYNHTVDNDFAVAYDQVKNTRQRLEVIKGLEPTSPEYQQGMDDVRGIIRELDIGQQEAIAWSYWWAIALLVMGIVILVIGIIVILETTRIAPAKVRR